MALHHKALANVKKRKQKKLGIRKNTQRVKTKQKKSTVSAANGEPSKAERTSSLFKKAS